MKSFLACLFSALLIVGCSTVPVPVPIPYPVPENDTPDTPTPPTPTPQPVPDTPKPDAKPETKPEGDPEDKLQPAAYAPRWDTQGATLIKCNRWNIKTSKGTAKVLLASKYRDKTAWATLWDGSGYTEVMKHANPSDAGGRPRFYARKLGEAYKGPVTIRVHIPPAADVYMVIPNPAQEIK